MPPVEGDDMLISLIVVITLQVYIYQNIMLHTLNIYNFYLPKIHFKKLLRKRKRGNGHAPRVWETVHTICPSLEHEAGQSSFPHPRT